MRQGQEEARAGQRWGQEMVGWKTGDGHSQAPDQHSSAYRALHIRGLTCVCSVYAGRPGRRGGKEASFLPCAMWVPLEGSCGHVLGALTIGGRAAKLYLLLCNRRDGH